MISKLNYILYKLEDEAKLQKSFLKAISPQRMYLFTLSAVSVGRKLRSSKSIFPGHLNLLILGHEERKAMKKIQCNLCGSERYEERRIEYLYSHKVNTC